MKLQYAETKIREKIQRKSFLQWKAVWQTKVQKRIAYTTAVRHFPTAAPTQREFDPEWYSYNDSEDEDDSSYFWKDGIRYRYRSQHRQSASKNKEPELNQDLDWDPFDLKTLIVQRDLTNTSFMGGFSTMEIRRHWSAALCSYLPDPERTQDLVFLGWTLAKIGVPLDEVQIKERQAIGRFMMQNLSSSDYKASFEFHLKYFIATNNEVTQIPSRIGVQNLIFLISPHPTLTNQKGNTDHSEILKQQLGHSSFNNFSHYTANGSAAMTGAIKYWNGEKQRLVDMLALIGGPNPVPVLFISLGNHHSEIKIREMLELDSLKQISESKIIGLELFAGGAAESNKACSSLFQSLQWLANQNAPKLTKKLELSFTDLYQHFSNHLGLPDLLFEISNAENPLEDPESNGIICNFFLEQLNAVHREVFQVISRDVMFHSIQDFEKTKVLKQVLQFPPLEIVRSISGFDEKRILRKSYSAYVDKFLKMISSESTALRFSIQDFIASYFKGQLGSVFPIGLIFEKLLCHLLQNATGLYLSVFAESLQVKEPLQIPPHISTILYQRPPKRTLSPNAEESPSKRRQKERQADESNHERKRSRDTPSREKDQDHKKKVEGIDVDIKSLLDQELAESKHFEKLLAFWMNQVQ